MFEDSLNQKLLHQCYRFGPTVSKINIKLDENMGRCEKRDSYTQKK